MPPPEPSGRSTCVYCGAEHRSGRTCEVLAAALAERPGWHDWEDAARIPLTEDAVLDLLRQHFAESDSIFVCPHVPPAQEQAARREHIAYLPAGERILALHDATLLGGGHEGFVVTAERICWKNLGEAACSIAWRNLEPDQLYIDGQWLFLGHDAILLPETEVQDACANAFHVLALSALPPQSGASAETLRDTLPDLPATESSADVSRRSRTTPKRKKKTKKKTPAAAARTGTAPTPITNVSYVAHVAHATQAAAETPPACSCWHCQTPLYETTRQCTYCGAEPKPTGWLRTG